MKISIKIDIIIRVYNEVLFQSQRGNCEGDYTIFLIFLPLINKTTQC